MRQSARPLAASLLALCAAPAFAAEPLTASLGGYFNIGMGFANKAANPGSDAQFGVFRDGEISIDVEGAADNGLTFFGQVELEAFSSADPVDENCFGVKGAFGEAFVGGCDTALNEIGGVGVVKPNGSYLNYYDSSGDVMPGHPGGFIGEDDAVGLHYATPTVAGFTAGVTWQPDPNADGGADSNSLVTPPDGPDDNQIAVAARYEGEFDGVSLAVGGGWLGNEGLDQWHAGAQIGYAGISAAGFYNISDPDAALGGPEVETFGLGAMHAAGPWSFGGGYARQELDGVAPGATDRRDFVHVGGGYDLAPGVTAYAAGQWGRDDPGQDGVGAYAWLNLRF